MATIEEAFANVQREVGEIRTAVNTGVSKIDEQTAEIRRLQEIIEGGGTITAEQLDAVANELDEIAKPLEAIGTEPPVE